MTLDQALAAIRAELDRATQTFPRWPDDPMHALAVLGEEYGELTRAILQRSYEPEHPEATLEHIRHEATQTAASAIRLLMSVEHYRYAPVPNHAQPGLPARNTAEDTQK